MAIIHIRYKGGRFSAKLPRLVLLNGQPIGLMQTGNADVKVPEGNYMLTVQFGGRMTLYPRTAKTAVGRWLQKKHWQPDMSVGSTTPLHVNAGQELTVSYMDRERIWNILFDIDLVLWLAEFFITLPDPWHLVYKILSDGFFLIWMVRMYLIRKTYYRMEIA